MESPKAAAAATAQADARTIFELAARPDDIVFITENAAGAAALKEWGLLAFARPVGGEWNPNRLRLYNGRRVAIVQTKPLSFDDGWSERDYTQFEDTTARACIFIPPECVDYSSPFTDLPTLVTWNRSRAIGPSYFVEQAANELGDPIPRVPPPEEYQGPRAIVVRMADVKPRALEWLWPGRIPLGGLTTIAGDPGLGKSFLTLDIAARVSIGCRWPDDPDGRNVAGAVVTFSAEDDAATVVVPRLIAAGADMRRVFAVDGVTERDGGRRSFSLIDLPILEDAIENAVSSCGCPVRLVVIDPVTAFVGGSDDHRNAEVRALLAPLAAAAARGGFAIVLVTHLNKNSAGRSLSRVMGSIAWTAAARAAWLVAKSKDDPAKRLFLSIKNNLAADPSGLSYRLERQGATARVMWDAEPVAIQADEALADNGGRDGDGPELNAAREFLREVLTGVPIRAVDVFNAAEARGINSKVLRQAKTKEGIEALQLERAWWWRYPPADSQLLDQPAA